jgi:hypothetical protein
MRARKKDAAALQRPTNLKSLVPAPTAVPAAAGKQQNEKDNYEKRRGIHVRLPRNAAYCAAWNSGFLTTFRWSSGSRNARGEMAHSDALTSACLLSLKGSVASFWLCADDFRSSPTRRQMQSPSSFAFAPSRDICTTAISRSFDHLGTSKE